MSSTRLPGKILLPINKKSMLECVIHQTRQSKFVNEIIIATTKNKEDDIIINFCKKNKIKYFRGSKNDVLDRYYQCAKKFNCEIIVRITSDCPMIDPEVIDEGIEKFLKKSLDYIGNNIDYIDKKWQNSTCNFPQGMTVEVCKFNTLKKTWKNAKKPSEREHVFPYVQFNSSIFRIGNFKKNLDLSYIRCTVDRKEDLKFVTAVYKKLENRIDIVRIKDILKIIKKNKKLLDINTQIPFDEGYRISLQKDIENVIKQNKIQNSSQKIKVILCVDGGHKIGMGHIYRMKNLSEYFPKNFDTYFLTNTKNFTTKIIKSKKFIDIKKSPFFMENKLEEINPDLIIVDKLKDSNKNLEIFKKNSKFLIGVDYTGKNKNILDLGISMLYHKTALSSINLKNMFNFGILNKSFLKYPKIKIKKEIKSIILLQGGSDTHCFIPKILNAINLIDDNLKITVVTGSGFKCLKQLQKSVQDSKHNVKIFHNISNMHKVMSSHDMAITAGGMTLLELAYLGIPSIIVCGEKFEEETASKISTMGFGINLGFGEKVSTKQIAQKIDLLMHNFQNRKKMNNLGRQIIDGNGAVKISQIIQYIGSN
jgi:spore coat polysaccharide biosynthesis protein SpsF